jgi:formamidopyrimidine-DNA glycosylase
MPELPEVETIRTGLDRLLIGQIVSNVSVLWAKSYSSPLPSRQILIGCQVVGSRRFGKLLVVDFDNGLSLMAHLRMTGQLIVVSPEQTVLLELPDKTTRVIITFESGVTLYFNDQRKFGRIVVVPTSEVGNDAFINALGPDPTRPGFTVRTLTESLAGKQLSIKAALLDQHVIAGIGNIYADEVLWSAHIHPLTPSADLTPDQLATLATQIRTVLRKAISKGGSTSRNYLNADGIRGTYLDKAYVYGRTGQPCKRCKSPIAKIKVAGRGTHYCPQCQPSPTPQAFRAAK